MRVLHICNDYYNSGVYRTLHLGFLEDGMDSVYFVPMYNSDKPREMPKVLEAHCFSRWDRFLYMNKQKKIYGHFRKAVQQCNPDLNHGLFLYSGGIHCLWAKQEFGIPYVVTVQDTDINAIYRFMPHLRGLARRILKEAAGIVFVSAAYRDFVLDHVVRPEDRETIEQKCRLIPFAVDPFWTENIVAEPVCKTPSSPLRLLTVGIVGKRKNQLGTIEAVRLLQQRGIDVELTVIGAPENAEIDRIVCATSFVRRISYIQKEELIKEYRKADIFVLPSFTESFGLVYAEALTQGVPVVYSAGQGFDYQFPEGTVGYRVNAQSPEDIADGILRVLQEYDNLIKNCSEAASCFTRTAVCSAYEQFYRELIANKN